MTSKRFRVGKTLTNGSPCVVYGEGSILCEVPSQQDSHVKASEIAAALNEYYGSNYHNMPGMPDEDES